MRFAEQIRRIKNEHARIRLAIQWSLLDEISVELRAVAYECDGKRLVLRAIFDGPICAEDLESMDRTTRKLVVALGAEFEVVLELRVIVEPLSVLQYVFGSCVYRRRSRAVEDVNA